jgi:TatD DNase family protein
LIPDIHTHRPNRPNSIFNLRLLKDEIPETGLFSVGLHPWDISQNLEDWEQKLRKVITHPRCILVGECGLERSISPSLEQQKVYFIKQVKMAKEYNKNLILHCVRAYEECHQVLQELSFPGKVIFHDYNGAPQITEKFVDYGYFFSFGQSLLRKKSKGIEGLSLIPLKQFLLESDESQTPLKDLFKKAGQRLQVTEDELTQSLKKSFKSFTNIEKGY